MAGDRAARPSRSARSASPTTTRRCSCITTTAIWAAAPRRSAISSRTGYCAARCSTAPRSCRASSCSRRAPWPRWRRTRAALSVRLADGAQLRTRLVAAADGQNSPLRRAAGIGTVEWRYRQTGIVTTVRHERPHGGIAVEHFLPAGPFAILPMTDDIRGAAYTRRARSSIVWTEDADLAPRLLALARCANSPRSCAPGSAIFSAPSSRSGRAGATRWR